MAVALDALEIGRLYSRPQLAKLWGYRAYQAISRGVVTPRDSSVIILFVTRQKQQTLTQYQDFLSGDFLHWEGEAGHRSDDRIARAYARGEEIHLFYRDIHHTPFRYYGPLEILRFMPRSTEPSQFVFRVLHDLGPEDDLASHAHELEQVERTERELLVRARVGQGRFRDDLLELWAGCAVTGIASPELVKASHIKPWRVCSNSERLDRFNGLLLLPQYDHLFDRGYITFDDRGQLQPSPAIVTLPARLLGIEMNARLRKVAQEHLPFLDYHRHEVFLTRVEAD